MAVPTQAARERRPLRRTQDDRHLAGVAAGIARWLEVDPLIVRVAFIAAAAAGGFGIAVYVLAWIFMPAEPSTGPTVLVGRQWRTGRSEIEIALGVGLLVLSALLTFRALGIWFSDAVVWPTVLIAAGGALLWRSSQAPSEASVAPAQAEPEDPGEAAGRRVATLSRNGVGIALVVAAGLIFLQATGALSAARDVVFATVAVSVVLGVIFAPWIVRLVRTLTAERAERIRSQERAEVAAHLHDSVLQTLALVQQRAEDPRAVATLARRQERELRAWLSGRDRAEGKLSSALEAAAEEVERDHGIAVDVVAVGDAELDPPLEALAAAAREAMVNAAKFGGGVPVAVYAEADDGRVTVFVRDRGPGFDPHTVPPDRRGVRDSIVGRMQRHGGHAEIHSSPGAGTEVELVLERS